jgi:hypothetical protein
LAINAERVQQIGSVRMRDVAAVIIGALSLGFCLYNSYFNEPVIDFRPYAIGNDIADLRIEKRAPKLQMEWHYHNKTTGQWETISYEQMMKGALKPELYDTNYREDKVLDPGIPARILGLNIYDPNDEDITDTLLTNPNYSLMVVAYNLDKTHEKAFQQLNAISAGCDKAGIKFFAVVGNNGKIEEFRHKNQTAYPFYHADETPIKTMMRSNPGLMLLKKGVIVNKWHEGHFPTFEELNAQYFSKK